MNIWCSSKTYAGIFWSEMHQLFTLKILFDAADISIIFSISSNTVLKAWCSRLVWSTSITRIKWQYFLFSLKLNKFYVSSNFNIATSFCNGFMLTGMIISFSSIIVWAIISLVGKRWENLNFLPYVSSIPWSYLSSNSSNAWLILVFLPPESITITFPSGFAFLTIKNFSKAVRKYQYLKNRNCNYSRKKNNNK